MKTIIYITFVFFISCEDPLIFEANYTPGIVKVCTPEYCGIGFYVHQGEIVTTGNLISDGMYLIIDNEKTTVFEIMKTDNHNNLALISTFATGDHYAYKICDNEPAYGLHVYADNGDEIKDGQAYSGMVPMIEDWIATTIDAPQADEGSPILDSDKECVVTVGVDRIAKLCGPSTESVRNFVRN